MCFNLAICLDLIYLLQQVGLCRCWIRQPAINSFECRFEGNWLFQLLSSQSISKLVKQTLLSVLNPKQSHISILTQTQDGPGYLIKTTVHNLNVIGQQAPKKESWTDMDPERDNTYCFMIALPKDAKEVFFNCPVRSNWNFSQTRDLYRPFLTVLWAGRVGHCLHFIDFHLARCPWTKFVACYLSKERNQNF